MRALLTASAVVLLGSTPVRGQDTVPAPPPDSVLALAATCGFTGSTGPQAVNPVDAHPEILAITDTILRIHGLRESNLKVVGASGIAARVALAGIGQADGIRYVVYASELDALLVNRTVPVDVVGILAHEIGHQLLGHTLGMEKRKTQEDDADYFAGHMLRMMGYRRPDTQEFVTRTVKKEETDTHRGVEGRKQSVLAGWQTADDYVVRNHEHARGHARVPQERFVKSPAEAPSQLVRTEWIGYLVLDGDAHGYPISPDGRIYRVDGSSSFTFVGMKSPPASDAFAWSWATAASALDVDPAGRVFVRMPTGATRLVGSIVGALH